MKSVSIIAVVLALLAISHGVQAQSTVLLQDTFGDNGRTNGPSADDTAWYTTNSSGSNLTVSGGTMVLGGGLQQIAFAGAFAGGAQQTIGIGNALELSFNFNFQASPSSNLAGLRFGLYNSNGTSLISDNSTADDNDLGYFAFLHTGAGIGSDFRKETGTSNSPVIGGDNADLDAASSSTLATPTFGTGSHTARMILTRTATSSLLLELLVNNISLYSVTDTNATGGFITFDEVAIGRGAITQNLVVDNITVTYYPVPEPASLGLIAFGGLTLLQRRRR